MNTNSSAGLRGGVLTCVGICIGLWIGIMAEANWHRYAITAAIMLAFGAVVLNYKQYQTYKEETAKRNMPQSTMYYVFVSSLYNAAWIYLFGLIGRGIRFVLPG